MLDKAHSVQALGDLYMAASDPSSQQEYDRLVQHRAGFHVLGCFLTVLLFPLLLICSYRAVRSMLCGRAGSPEPCLEPCVHPEQLHKSHSCSSLLKRHLLPGADTGNSRESTDQLYDDMEASGRLSARDQVMREVIFDVTKEDTLQMR